jgi:integrase
LVELVDQNPLTDNSDTQYVFFSDRDPRKPCTGDLFVRYLKRAIKAAGIELDGRVIDFHGLRHYKATDTANKTGDNRKVAKITRHKNLNMAAHYSNHIKEAEIIKLGEELSNMVAFKKEA